MKISHKDLSEIYQAHIGGKVPPTTDYCFSLDALDKFFDARVSKGLKSEIIEHVTNCAYCMSKFSLLLEMHRGTTLLTQELENYAEDKAAFKPKKKRLNNFLYSSRPLWVKTAVFSGIAISLICVFVSVIFLFQSAFNKDALRRRDQHISRIVDSKAKYSKNSGIQISWTQIQSAEYSILEVFDDSLAPIWRSQALFENHCLIDVKFMKDWVSNKYYFWMVTGYTETGRAIDYPLTKFLLTD